MGKITYLLCRAYGLPHCLIEANGDTITMLSSLLNEYIMCAGKHGELVLTFIYSFYSRQKWI